MNVISFLTFTRSLMSDDWQIGIGGVLRQDGHPAAYFRKNKKDFHKKFSPYDMEFYGVVQTIRHWHHYFDWKGICAIL